MTSHGEKKIIHWTIKPVNYIDIFVNPEATSLYRKYALNLKEKNEFSLNGIELKRRKISNKLSDGYFDGQLGLATRSVVL